MKERITGSYDLDTETVEGNYDESKCHTNQLMESVLTCFSSVFLGISLTTMGDGFPCLSTLSMPNLMKQFFIVSDVTEVGTGRTFSNETGDWRQDFVK